MGKLAMGIFGVFLFGSLGSLIGDTATLIGVILGIMMGFAHKPEEAKKKAENEKEAASNLTFHKATTEIDELYVDVVTELIAACITADSLIEESEIDLATSFIESDDLIIVKKAALDMLKMKIDVFHKERSKSKAVFKLRLTSLTHKAKEIKSSLQKERILIILDGMLLTRQSNR